MVSFLGQLLSSPVSSSGSLDSHENLAWIEGFRYHLVGVYRRCGEKSARFAERSQTCYFRRDNTCRMEYSWRRDNKRLPRLRYAPLIDIREHR